MTDYPVKSCTSLIVRFVIIIFFLLLVIFDMSFILILMCLQFFTSRERSSVWGQSDIILPPHYAAFVNGIAVSLDFYKSKNLQKTGIMIQLCFDP